MMDKSINDIDRQAERIIAMLDPSDKQGWRYPMYIRKLAMRVKWKRGFSLFDRDKDKKRPWDASKFEKPQTIRKKPWWQNLKPYTPKQRPCKDEKPMTAAEKRQLERKLNDLCRHDFLRKMLSEVASDMTICKMNGWDVMELPRLLKAELDSIISKRNPQQLTLFEE